MISAPSSDNKPIACFVGNMVLTIPFTGEYKIPSSGSIAIPFPIASLAKVESSTSVSFTIAPLQGALISIFLLSSLIAFFISGSMVSSFLLNTFVNTNALIKLTTITTPA